MLDFSKINKPDFLYNLLYWETKYIHNLVYYKAYRVHNRKRIPKDEGCLIICNHQNGLNDALALLMMSHKRRTVFIARGDIFKKDTLGKFLRFLKILPAFRKRDTGVEGLKDNDLIFEESARIISEGDNVAIFPEASHQRGHFLNTFKKGFARIAFRTAEKSDFTKPVKILPVGIHYDTYFHIESRLLVNVGEPFEFTDLYDLYKEHPEKAQHDLAEIARAKVQELMLDITDKENYDAVYNLCSIYRKRWIKLNRALPVYENEFKADREMNARLMAFKESDNEAYEALIADSEQYMENLGKLKLRDWIFERKVFVWSGLRGLLWLCYSPILLALHIINVIPYKASNILTRKMEDKNLHASMHIGLGVLVVVPLWSLLVLAAVWIFTKKFWIALLSMLVWPFTLKLYYHFKVDAIKLYNRYRRTFFILKKDKLFRETGALRAKIVKQLDKLMNLQEIDD